MRFKKLSTHHLSMRYLKSDMFFAHQVLLSVRKYSQEK